MGKMIPQTEDATPVMNNLGKLFAIWFAIGIQSFGGGSATFYLIFNNATKYHWLTEEEFLSAWALAQLTPGINLIKVTILIGRKLRGWKGSTVAVAGLLLPSTIITVLMTAFYAAVQSYPLVKAAMRGILPATIGLALTMTVRMTSPMLKLAVLEGKNRFAIHFAVICVAAITMAVGKVSPAIILIMAGVVSVLLFQLIPSKTEIKPKEDIK